MLEPRSAATWLFAVALLGCKPAEEPARRAVAGEDAGPAWPAAPDIGSAGLTPRPSVADPPIAAPPLVGELPPTALADAGPADPGEDAAMDAGAVASAADGADAGADTVADTLDAAAEPPTASVVALPAELVARVRAAVPEPAQEEARRLNRVGLQKHRRLELAGATRDYLEALEAWPGHSFANYNLACAYALTGRPEEALRHLAILDAIGDRATRERLRSARTDADFESLAGDPRFRALTGYAPVLVSWSPGREQRAEAQELVTSLRSADVAARAASVAWPEGFSRPTLLVRRGDPTAAAAAAELRRAVHLGALDVVADAPLGADPTVVLVLPGPIGAATPKPLPSPAPKETDPPVSTPPRPDGPAGTTPHGRTGAARTLAELVGARLVARVGAGTARLLLKPTGFFEWDQSRADGGRTRRRGRYAVRGSVLALDYREDVETPGASPAAPEIRVEEGRRSEHPFRLTPDGLSLDGVDYRLP